MYLSISPSDEQGSVRETETHRPWERPMVGANTGLCESGSQRLSSEFMPAGEQVLQLPVPQFPHCKMGRAEKDALADPFGFRVSKSPIQSTEFQMGLFIPFLMQF